MKFLPSWFFYEQLLSGIIAEWKYLGTTATEPQSVRPRKVTEWC